MGLKLISLPQSRTERPIRVYVSFLVHVGWTGHGTLVLDIRKADHVRAFRSDLTCFRNWRVERKCSRKSAVCTSPKNFIQILRTLFFRRCFETESLLLLWVVHGNLDVSSVLLTLY